MMLKYLRMGIGSKAWRTAPAGACSLSQGRYAASERNQDMPGRCSGSCKYRIA
jgi:hypothetical protein